MTVSYTSSLHSSSFYGYVGLLFRWRGSIWQLIWKEFLILVCIHTIIECMYIYVMNADDQAMQVWISTYCNSSTKLIPVGMVMGFYVNRVFKRFWAQYIGIPWPHRIAILLSTYIHTHKNDDAGLLMRRTIIRYVNLAIVMSLVGICKQVRRRFPTLTHLTEAGFLLPAEEEILSAIQTIPLKSKYNIPLLWSNCIIIYAKKRGKIKDDLAVQRLVNEINTLRGTCGTLLSFDIFTLPLVYSQILVVAVYVTIYAILLGNIPLDIPSATYIQVYYNYIETIVFFVIYFGWEKVAEVTVNPFGDDDDDFECNMLIDRFLHESFMIVDELFDVVPKLMRDKHWDDLEVVIPYTEESERFKKHRLVGSAKGLVIPEKLQNFVNFKKWQTTRKTRGLQSTADPDEQQPRRTEATEAEQAKKDEENEQFESGLSNRLNAVRE